MPVGYRWFDAGALGDAVNHPLAKSLLHLGWADAVVLARTNPVLHLVTQTICFNWPRIPSGRSGCSCITWLSTSASPRCSPVLFRGCAAGDRRQGVEKG
jgi:hypothetical protein